jgi:hypothetical protein
MVSIYLDLKKSFLECNGSLWRQARQANIVKLKLDNSIAVDIAWQTLIGRQGTH